MITLLSVTETRFRSIPLHKKEPLPITLRTKQINLIYLRFHAQIVINNDDADIQTINS